MEHRIGVPYVRIETDKSVSLSVVYSSEQQNEAVTLYNCKVDLHADEIPEWITPEFVVRKVRRTGVTSTHVEPRPGVNWASPDALLFADETAQAIRVKDTAERLRG